MSKRATAVFFISFGGPEKRDDVMPFLEIVTRGRGVPRERLEEVAHHYELMGGASPINAITARQASALRTLLAASSEPLPVYIGNRNWHPFIEDTLRQMMTDGITKAIGFITAAHRTEASLERYIRAVETAQQKIGPSAPQIDYVGPWFDHPLFIEAIAEKIKTISFGPFARSPVLPVAPNGPNRLNGQNGLNAVDIEWLFTAHSIPCSMAKDSTYVIELQRTAELVCQSLGRTQWRLAYSSRSGNPRDAWLEPDVCDAIREAARRGVRKALLVPIGFVADHVEVLFDLDVEAKEAADAAGVTLFRAETVGEHPRFIEMIQAVVRDRMAKDPETLAIDSKRTQFADGVQAENLGRASAQCYCFPGSDSPPCLRTAPARPQTVSS